MTEMTLRSFTFRVIDNLFKRKVLYILPIIVLGALGVWLASGEETFESVGVVQVAPETLVADIADVGTDGLDFRTPAEIANDELFGLVLTDSFMAEVVSLNGLDEAFNAPNPEDETFLGAVRDLIETEASGDDFVTVTAVSDDRVIAQALAQSVIDNFISRRINADLQESRIAEAFFSELVLARDIEADEARDELAAWLIDNPGPNTITDRPIDQQVRIQTFEGSIAEAEIRFNEAVDQQEQAQLAAAQVEADVRQSFLTIDPPQIPRDPQNGPVDLAILGVSFAVVGVLLSGAVLLLTSAADTSLRFPAEVEELVGAELLAVIPKVVN